MALGAEEIAGCAVLYDRVTEQSRTLVLAYQANPRVAAVFATQQRWLMAHAGLKLYFRRDPSDPRKGLTSSRFLELIAEHRIASRNTADAFLKELLEYGIAAYLPGGDDRRVRPIGPTQAALDALLEWTVAHLTTLDGLDGGGRLARFTTEQGSLARLQPLIAEGLLSSRPVREPEQTFSIFTWLNQGGIVMDWLISRTGDIDADAERFPAGAMSIATFAGLLKISRTHLDRKLRAAEALGSIGWEGARGRSTMWVSKGFRQEYMAAQAVKLAVVDAAYDRCFAGV